MTQLNNLTTEQIISYLQEKRDILIPTTIAREDIDEVMGTQMTKEEWIRECENIQDVFGAHLKNNLLDELSYLNQNDDFELEVTSYPSTTPKRIYQEIVQEDADNYVDMTLSVTNLKVIHNILVDTPFESAQAIAIDVLQSLKDHSFDKEANDLPF